MTHQHHAVGGGPPVLDIGDGVGALLVLMDDDAARTELHVRLAGRTDSVHTGVWTRHVDDGHITAALFCELHEGIYRVLHDDGSERAEVAVKGGELSELDLRPEAATRAARGR
jgi:hypothetical protein